MATLCFLIPTRLGEKAALLANRDLIPTCKQESAKFDTAVSVGVNATRQAVDAAIID